MNFEFRVEPLGFSPYRMGRMVACVTIHRKPCETQPALHRWIFVADEPRQYGLRTLRAASIVNQMFMSTTRGLNP